MGFVLSANRFCKHNTKKAENNEATTNHKIKNTAKKALLSVIDKDGILDFARGLVELGYEILSTGGTLATLKSNGINAIEVSHYTQSPELFSGRVKTLHPKIHGGILYRRDNQNDCKTAQENGIEDISLVCVNLYPFFATTKRTDDFSEIIENIDIGGPTLIRAAAKSFQSVLVLVSPSDYEMALQNLKTNQNTLDFRKSMMIKAFSHTAHYDTMIANYMNERFNDGFGEFAFISGRKVCQTRYGENPHQKGALYEITEISDFYSKQFCAIKGEASFNNLTDMNAAIKLASAFSDKNKNGKNLCAVSIIKHGNPCGFALKDSLLEAYKSALKCDSVSAYGGVVAINGIIDENLANEMSKTYIEVLVACDITQGALEILSSKKRQKIFITKQERLALPCVSYDFKRIDGGLLYQQSDSVGIDEVANAELKSLKRASACELIDLEIAYKIAALTKSNCVAYVKDSALVAIGMGMTSRVDASRAALAKASDMGLDVRGCALASEAVFPFRNSIYLAASVGVSAVICPGGSMRDSEVIDAANEHKIALYFTGIRHFLH